VEIDLGDLDPADALAEFNGRRQAQSQVSEIPEKLRDVDASDLYRELSKRDRDLDARIKQLWEEKVASE